MKAAKILLLFIVVIVVSSCAKQPDAIQIARNIVYSNLEANIKKFNEDSNQFAKDYEAYKILYKSYRKKDNSFLNLLFNEELKAYSDLEEAYKSNNNPKLIIARRNFINLLEKYRTPNELIIFNNILKEGRQVDEKYAELNIKAQELDKRQKEIQNTAASLSEWEKKREEDRNRKEMLSAINHIGSSLDKLRFDLDQARTDRFLGIR